MTDRSESGEDEAIEPDARINLALSGQQLQARMPCAVAEIGLIRGEYVFRRARAYVTVERGYNALREYLEKLLVLYPDILVWYRFSELDVEEVKVLDGCDDFAINDRILSMGARGVRRYMLHAEAFRLELEIVTALSAANANLGVIVPFVADVTEASWALDEIRRAGFSGAAATMLEIPAAVMCFDDILALGYERGVFGLNDASAFVMGSYRGSNRYPGIPEGVKRMIEFAHTIAEERGATVKVAGNMDEMKYGALRRIRHTGAIVHYAELPKIFGEKFQSLPELSIVSDIKAWTRRAISLRRSDAGIMPVDPYGN